MNLSRRNFLRGAAGATLGLPFLEMLAPKAALAGGGKGSPKRIFLMLTGFSVQIGDGGPDSFSPENPGGAATTSLATGALPPILEPLSAYRDRMTVVSGVDNVMSPLMASNGHNASGKTVMTCAPMRNGIDANGDLIVDAPCGQPYDDSQNGNDGRSQCTGPSFDHFLADRLGDRLLPLCVGRQHGEHMMRWRQTGDTVSFSNGYENPQGAYDDLFGGMMSGPPSPLEQLRGRRVSILDKVRGELGALRARAGAADRERLDRHTALIEAYEQELAQTVTIACETPTRPVLGGRGISEGEVLNGLNDGEGPYDDLLFDAHFGLAATAFACQATRVASLHHRRIQVNTFPWLNGGQPLINANWHAVVHHDEGTPEQRRAIFSWYATALRGFLDRLAAIPDGPDDATLLDNTLVVWVSSLRQSSHNTNNLPVLLVGDLQGAVRSGIHADYRGASRTLGDLWTTLANAMDVPITSFGWNRGTARNGRAFNNGPLENVLV